MTEVAIRDYQRDVIVGHVSDERGLITNDETLAYVAERLTEKGEYRYAVNPIIPGHNAGEYQELVLEAGDRGYALSLVDSLPSPFDIDDLDRRRELAAPATEPVD
ncbi:MAG: hypothetical protein ACLFMX_02665 [Halobacteriales archaeon]